MDVLLEAKNLSFDYGSKSVLRDLDLSCKAGESIGLIGPNGAGKTTLLRLFMGLVSPSTGEVELCGENLRQLRRKEIARRVSLVPQDVALSFALTVREVVSMGRNPHLGRFEPEGDKDIEIVQHALEVTEVEVLADRAVDTLSGGERQRVLIARALAQETPVLLLDEPTANLDLCHQLEVLQLLKKLTSKGVCAVAAIHDLSLASRFFDRLLLVSNQQIVADGSPESVLTEENLWRYFRIRAVIEQAPEGGGLSVIPIEASPR
jgi:iron complex transport system ATP-binding protein